MNTYTVTLTQEQLDAIVHALTFAASHTTGLTLKGTKDSKDALELLQVTYKEGNVPEWARAKK